MEKDASVNSVVGPNRTKMYTITRNLAVIITSVLLFTFYHFFRVSNSVFSVSPPYQPVEDNLRGYCNHIPSISNDEYISRQNRLGKTLREIGATAYIAEPGANTQFFGNFSNSNWRLSERPLLMIVLAESSDSFSGPQIIILTPKVVPKFHSTHPNPTHSSRTPFHFVYVSLRLHGPKRSPFRVRPLVEG